MPKRKCLFCDNVPNSKEHIFPKWVLAKLPEQPLYGFVGPHKEVTIHKQWLVGTVCRDCNSGWMSDLETTASPLLGPLIHGNPKHFDKHAQSIIAAWSTKMAMLMDSITVAPHRPLFYQRGEGISLRDSLSIPARTFVWFGRYLAIGLSAESSGCYYNVPGRIELFGGFVCTLLIGQLTIQSLTIRAPEEYSHGAILLNPTPGPWGELLAQVWPFQHSIHWPPIIAFDKKVFPRNLLSDRWRRGNERKTF